ncbi:MAG: hypothetical protein KF902_14740 [Phycisphaeraceae bacterium]|nr:hypothetical protein [Phycisphaeraceae bacterium]
MRIRLSSVVASVAGLAIAAPALGQSIPWLSPVDGNWNDATKWTGGNIPNAPGESAVLGLSGPYTVSLNIANLSLDSINVSNASATLNLPGTTITTLSGLLLNSGHVNSSSGVNTLVSPFTNQLGGRFTVTNGTTLSIRSDFVNDGTIDVNPTSGVSVTTFRMENPIAVSGSGAIVLGAPATRATIANLVGGSLTNGANHTIRGQGQISTPLTNNGTITADTGSLILSSNAKANNGTMRSAGGSLEIGVVVTQGASALIEADGTNVLLNTATINGGLITSTGPGRFRANSGASIFNAVESEAYVELSSASVLTLGSGTYTNNGVIDVNWNLGGSATSLRTDGPMTIDGTGEIILRRPGTQSQILAVGGVAGSLTLGSGQTVRGQGLISLFTINNGEILADAPGGTLALSTHGKTNNNLMAASGGTLQVSSITITQGASGEIHADGSNVDLTASRIVGGTLRSSNGGSLRSMSSVSTLESVSSEASVTVENGTILGLAGTGFVNNGVVTINPTGGASATALRIDESLTISGTGQIVLNAPATRAQITSASGALTLGSGQTVRGHGRITAAMNNYGTIVADTPGQSIELQTNAKWNYGVIRADGGKVIASTVSIPQFGSGTLRADNADFELSSSSIIAGKLATSGTGTFATTGGSTLLHNVDSEGRIEVRNGTGLTLEAGLVNNGVIHVNPSVGGSATTISLILGNTISGTGEIVLGAPGSRAQITSASSGSLTLGPGQTLRGIGQIVVPTTNQGTIAPGLSVGTLLVSSSLTWQPTSVLDVELASASSFDKINGGNHTINGGTVNVSLVGGYVPALFAKHAVIDGVSGSVITGGFTSVNGPALPEPWVWRVGVDGNDVVVGASCPSDVNSDFIVDIVDFLDFLDAFGSCDGSPAPCAGSTGVSADYNGDTFVDILDFLDFFDAFGSGC